MHSLFCISQTVRDLLENFQTAIKRSSLTERVKKFTQTKKFQNINTCGLFNKHSASYHILSIKVRTFFKENYDQILPAHYTWKVPEKLFFCQKSFLN
jgi:hypothetical protein